MAVITLPTENGELEFSFFSHLGQEAVIVMNRNYEGIPFVRVHSSCVFSEVFHSNDCDCALQLDASLKYISDKGGFIIYLYQEGRGIGLEKKISAIQLQHEKGINTKDAFTELGHEPDPRSYDVAIKILHDLGAREIKLFTNNPRKIEALELGGIVIADRIRLEINTNKVMDKYIADKVNVLGHHEKN